VGSGARRGANKDAPEREWRFNLEMLWDLFHRIYDVEFLVRTGGLFVLIVIVFIETGLLVGFFLPGDSLLVTAGIFAARRDLDLLTPNTALSLAAIAGDTVGLGSEPARGAEIFHQGKFVIFQSQASHFGKGVL